METDNIIANILKLLPEPEIYDMPPDFLDRQMTLLWPRIIIRDRFTWLAKLNVLIHRWAVLCTPFLTKASQTEPEYALSDCLRPSKNHYEMCILSLATELGKFRPGKVPTEEGIDAITTTRGVFNVLRKIHFTSSLAACEEAFEAFIRVWNYQGASRLTQSDFRTALVDKARAYVTWIPATHNENPVLGASTPIAA